MKAIRLEKHGPPSALKYVEISDPEPGPGEVLVRVRAAGINFADIATRQGLYPNAPKLPSTPGVEVSGEVERIGAGVADLKPGQRVMGFVRSGGYAEKVCAPEGQLASMPDGMSFEQGAAFPVVYLTAYHMLYQVGCLRPGERVLIHAAAGGVGLASIELAREADAEIFGTASSSKFDFLRQRGAKHLIDYHHQDFEKEVRRLTNGEGVDLVLDAVGGDSLAKGYRLLRPMGRLIIFGFSSAVVGARRNYLRLAVSLLKTPRFSPFKLFAHNRAVIGVMLSFLRPEVLRREYPPLFKLYTEGKLHPHVDRTFPLSQAALAHEYIQARKNVGKVVLVPE